MYGFTRDFAFGYSSDEDDEVNESILEQSQADLIKSLKGHNFDEMGIPVL